MYFVVICVQDPALSYDIIYDSADPSHVHSGEGHGTNCAGVAGAAKNTDCVVGVAYDASLPAIRLLDGYIGATQADEALALTHELSSIDIYSNSWGPTDDGESFSGLASIQVEALQTGVTEGRGGKGAIYTWASGNGGYYYDDCNADGYANSIYTIAVAAMSETTAPTWYSEHCTAILAAAYSGDSPNAQITTTGPSDTCVNDFSGTSSATPVASGICALTLQANSALTWRDIQHMIVEYSISSGLHANASFYTNGAGYQVSHWFGFGLMDAEAMVDNAPSWQTVPSSTSCSSTQIDVYDSTVSENITSTYNATQCYISYLEHLVVTISYKASYRGDIEFYLDSPSGTQSILFRSRYYDSSSSKTTWDFMSVHNWGEDPEGEWTLTMSDVYGGTSMNLYYWNIQFYGTLTDPLAGTPAAGALGGPCSDSTNCSSLTDGGCLEDGEFCVVCNNGYRVLDIFCKQDGRLGGYCDDVIPCATSSLECTSNVCKVKQTDDGGSNTALIIGIVVGSVVGIALLTAVGFLVYKLLFSTKASATVAPAPHGDPPPYSSQQGVFSAAETPSNTSFQPSAHPGTLPPLRSVP
ncbi:furin-1-like [Mercenaria mercenaria]|uniref:furin-1-like n=1 Tax=Mercenaria mercenaria TaxID=6596 RepID=UPI00234EDC4F|nr:furin-1-like [Mercenaria mercenaria]